MLGLKLIHISERGHMSQRHHVRFQRPPFSNTSANTMYKILISLFHGSIIWDSWERFKVLSVSKKRKRLFYYPETLIVYGKVTEGSIWILTKLFWHSDSIYRKVQWIYKLNQKSSSGNNLLRITITEYNDTILITICTALIKSGSS